MPEDSFLAGGVTEKVALNGSVLASIHVGGPARTELRTFRWEVLILGGPNIRSRSGHPGLAHTSLQPVGVGGSSVTREDRPDPPS